MSPGRQNSLVHELAPESRRSRHSTRIHQGGATAEIKYCHTNPFVHVGKFTFKTTNPLKLMAGQVISIGSQSRLLDSVAPAVRAYWDCYNDFAAGYSESMAVHANNLLPLICLFEDLGAEKTNEIGSFCDWQRINKGSEVISQKQTSNDVYFVMEGRVAAKGYSHEGKEVTYAEIAKGEVFGEFSAIDQEPRSSSIEAIEDSFLARMTSDDFRKLIIQFPEVGLRLAELLVAKNRALTNRMFEFSTMAVSQRICAELLRMLEDAEPAKNSGVISPAPSHYEIATRLSTHREAVSKELASLARADILKSGRKTIEILDVDRLRKMTSYDFK